MQIETTRAPRSCAARNARISLGEGSIAGSAQPGTITVSARERARSEWGASTTKPVCVLMRRSPAVTTRNSYHGVTMSLRSIPNTSQGIAKSNVSAPWSTTAATVCMAEN